jgi:hypothetical protein
MYLNHFVQEEVGDKEIADDMMRFINSCNIRSGEYETNMWIIKKLDRNSFIVFEDIPVENNHGFTCLLDNSFTASRSTLQREILKQAKRAGYEIDDSVIDKSLFDR